MNNKIPAGVVLLTVLLSVGTAGEVQLEGFPWPEPANEIVLVVPTISEEADIDGELNEDCWKDAGVINKFYRAKDAKAVSIEATVKVFYDGSNLVFGIDLPKVKTDESLEKCFLSEEYALLSSASSVRICLEPWHSHGIYYQFIIDPAGRKQDLRIYDESWSAKWTAAVGKSSERWQAEVLIPVSKILHRPKDGEVWGFNLALFGLNTERALSSTPIRLSLVDAERFGHLLFKGELSTKGVEGKRKSLPGIHREMKEAQLSSNRQMCGPELKEIAGELTGFVPGEEKRLKNGLKIRCLGLDNPKVMRSRYPFIYEKYENADLQRLRKEYKLDEVIAGGRNEFEQMLILNEWLHSNVPFGDPPHIGPYAFYVLEHGFAGQTFNCTYLSWTFTQLCNAVGWTAKLMTSAGHGTVDVWSNYWRKWVEIDPSHNSHIRIQGTGVALNSNEIRREYRRNKGVDMEMVFGTEQRAEKITLQRRAKDGLYRYRQEGYRWVSYKNRNNFFELPYAYRNFFYFMVEDEYNRGKEWITRRGTVDERYILAIRTDRVEDIFWTLNQAYIHLYDEGSKGLRVQLETVTPNFERFEVSIDNGDWHPTGATFVWKVHPGQNFLNSRSINKFGVRGPEHKIVLGVSEP
jgi:hypothetical protein